MADTERLKFEAQEPLVQQALALSSGTMAALTGYKELALLDEVQRTFVAFCMTDGAKHDHWMVAWKAFLKTREPRGPRSRKPVQQELFGSVLNLQD